MNFSVFFFYLILSYPLVDPLVNCPHVVTLETYLDLCLCASKAKFSDGMSVSTFTHAPYNSEVPELLNYLHFLVILLHTLIFIIWLLVTL